MDLLVIDLEMCMVPRDYRGKNYRYGHEIIQMGAVLLDEDFHEIGTQMQYVHPEHGVIDPNIQNLTGIRNSQVRKAPKLERALVQLLDWIGEREYRIYAWSDADWYQLSHEIRAKEITDPRILSFMESERWVDYQAVFSKRFSLHRPIGLEEALLRADIKAEGRFHDGLDDAVNTGRLIEKVEKNPELMLLDFSVPTKPSEHLSCSLGELFAGLDLQLEETPEPTDSSTGDA